MADPPFVIAELILWFTPSGNAVCCGHDDYLCRPLVPPLRRGPGQPVDPARSIVLRAILVTKDGGPSLRGMEVTPRSPLPVVISDRVAPSRSRYRTAAMTRAAASPPSDLTHLSGLGRTAGAPPSPNRAEPAKTSVSLVTHYPLFSMLGRNLTKPTARWQTSPQHFAVWSSHSMIMPAKTIQLGDLQPTPTGCNSDEKGSDR